MRSTKTTISISVVSLDWPMALKNAISIASLLVFVPFATAQSEAAAWAQCGGSSWQGPIVCVYGYRCNFVNQWYSQCVLDVRTAIPTVARPTSAPTATSTVGLAVAAEEAGEVYFGTATNNPQFIDEDYMAGLADTKQFRQITPGNAMKWDATEPTRGSFNWAPGDEVVALAEKNGQLLRGHTCVWHSQLPGWVAAGNFDNSALQSIIQNHTTAVVSHWKGKVWDVVNAKAFNEDGTWRLSIFSNTIGPSFVSVALQAAGAADPDTKLYLNDYNVEGINAKSNAMYELVKSLIEQGVPIDGVGLQGHLIVGQIPSTIQANIERFAALGVDVALTELDIRMTLPATETLWEQQKQDYQAVISACKSVTRCIGITIWDYTDRYSWVKSTFAGQGAALPWDEWLVKKPAYDGIAAGFVS